jgi:hypothetical protein
MRSSCTYSRWGLPAQEDLDRDVIFLRTGPLLGALAE